MVLGKRYDPEGDAMYKKVVEVETLSLDVSRRLEEVAKEAKDIEDGYLAAEHHEQALKQLLKRCKVSKEHIYFIFEALLSIHYF